MYTSDTWDENRNDNIEPMIVRDSYGPAGPWEGNSAESIVHATFGEPNPDTTRPYMPWRENPLLDRDVVSDSHSSHSSSSSDTRRDGDEDEDVVPGGHSSHSSSSPNTRREEEDVGILAQMPMTPPSYGPNLDMTPGHLTGDLLLSQNQNKRARVHDFGSDSDSEDDVLPPVRRSDARQAMQSGFFDSMQQLETSLRNETSQPTPDHISSAIEDGNVHMVTQWIADGHDLSLRDSDFGLIYGPSGVEVILLIKKTLPFIDGEIDIAYSAIKNIGNNDLLRDTLELLETAHKYPLSYDAMNALFERDETLFAEMSRFGRGPLMIETILSCTFYSKFWESLCDHFMILPQSLYPVIKTIRESTDRPPMQNAFLNFMFVTKRFPIDLDDMIADGEYFNEVMFLFNRYNLIPSKRGIDEMKFERRQFEDFIELVEDYALPDRTSSLVHDQYHRPYAPLARYIANP